MSNQNNKLVFLSNVRISFPHIAEPQVRKKSDGSTTQTYNADFLIPETHPSYQDFLQKVSRACAEKWNEHGQQVFQMCMGDRKCRNFGDGSEKINKKTFQPYEGYAGNKYITAISSNKPQIIRSEDGKAVDESDTLQWTQKARNIYGGCWVNAAVKIWLQDNKDHGRGIRAELVSIQFAKDDTPFGEAKPDASGLFTAVTQAPSQQAPSQQMPAQPFNQNVPSPFPTSPFKMN